MGFFSLILPLTILFSSIGLTFLLRTYIENLLSGFIIRSVGRIQRDTRIKVLVFPQILKGDVVSVGPVRTSLIEVGDGEHLPSIRTGRLIKVPNSMLVSNPIVIYGETIVDEVIAEVRLEGQRVEEAMRTMREAILAQGHKPMEVGIYQKGERLVVHGVFEAQIRSTTDERTKVLKDFLTRVPDLVTSSASRNANGSAVPLPAAEAIQPRA